MSCPADRAGWAKKAAAREVLLDGLGWAFAPPVREGSAGWGSSCGGPSVRDELDGACVIAATGHVGRRLVSSTGAGRGQCSDDGLGKTVGAGRVELGKGDCAAEPFSFDCRLGKLPGSHEEHDR